MRQYTTTKVNGIALYTCDDGYQLDSTNNQLTCDTGGEWIVKVPQCQGKLRILNFANINLQNQTCAEKFVQVSHFKSFSYRSNKN